MTATATDANNNTSELSYCRTIEKSTPTQLPLPPQLTSPKDGDTITTRAPLLNW